MLTKRSKNQCGTQLNQILNYFFNTDGRSHQTRILYVQGSVMAPSIDIFVTEMACTVIGDIAVAPSLRLVYFISPCPVFGVVKAIIAIGFTRQAFL